MTSCRVASRPLLVLMLFALFGGIAPAFGQTDSFNLVVPQVSSGSQLSAVEVTLRLNTTDPVRFAIRPPGGSSVTLPSSGYFSPGDGATSVDVSGTDDFVVVEPPEATGATVDQLQYKMVFALESDYDTPNCNSTMSGPETWTIDVEPQSGSDPRVTSACPVSFRQRGGVPSCTQVPPVQPDGPKARIGTEAVACQGSRPPVSTVLVLDKSGSMSSAASPGSAESRIEALRGSVDEFVETWRDIRAEEETAEGMFPSTIDLTRDDELGAVFFTGDAERLSDVGISNWSGRTDVLYDFSDLGDTDADDLTPNLNDVTPGGVTSLGDGLIEAVNALGTGGRPDRRKVVLAMSDGLQNSSEYVKEDGSTVMTHPKGNPSDTTPLVEPGDDVQIYTVTTGPSTTVGADLNEALADATGGDYQNAEVDASEMRLFFNQMLQNFVKFTSFETLHQAQPLLEEAGETYRSTVPVTVTSTSLVATLSAPRSAGYFGLRLRGPDGTTYEEEGSGTVTVTASLLEGDSTNAAGEWTAEVELIDPAGETAAPYLSVLADDYGVGADFRADAGDTEPGLTVPVTARVNGLEGPIENADAQVTVERPGAGVGDVLARADAKPTPPDVGDTFAPADAKLYRLLQRNPDALPRSSNTVQLRDDGNDADRRVGDGIYSAPVSVREPGHYTLRYVVEGTAERAGRFRREQIRTVHARAVPNPGPTEVRAQVGDGTLQLTIVPRTFTGGYLGPGFRNYLWLTTADGRQLRPDDQLDGTYTAQISFSGEPPRVNLHFLRLNTELSDEIERPPVALDEETRIGTGIEAGMDRTDPVPPGTEQPGSRDEGMSLVGMIALVFVVLAVLIGIFFVLRRRRGSS